MRIKKHVQFVHIWGKTKSFLTVLLSKCVSFRFSNLAKFDCGLRELKTKYSAFQYRLY